MRKKNQFAINNNFFFIFYSSLNFVTQKNDERIFHFMKQKTK